MRLGLLGGTFDPVHLGHLLLAEAARDELDLDPVLLVPASRPPHKPGRPITPYAVRYRMIELAVGGCEGLEASDLERDPDQPSYTVETLRRLASRHGERPEIWLVLGGDSLRELPGWREPEEIARLARLAVLARPGESSADAVPPGWRVDWLSGPRIRLSSSEVRERAAHGRSLRFLVPEAVRSYIEREGIYRSR